MQYCNLGHTGLKVSELCLGTMQFGWSADEALSFEILNAAYQAGVNFIDTADIYSRWVEGNPGGVSEEIIGKWLRKYQIPRHQVVIATKVRGQMGNGPNDQGLSRAHILDAVEASLRRLQIDYIDLYQVHWYDEDTPIEETLRALDDLQRQGKVRYVGASNYPAWRLMQALWTSERHDLVRFDSLQPHYSLAHRAEFERELAAICRHYGIGVIPYSPLASGFLTDKYQRARQDEPESYRSESVRRRYFNERGWRVHEAAEAVAEELECSISQVALAWLLAQAVVTSPIIGPRTLEQLSDNLAAVEVKLSPEQESRLSTASDWQEN
ncbi:MAG: aldo/keto reductase [Anaerolineales bacterium]|nr:aldo/keto reductase [Anaerolineales bacterium]